MNYPARLRRAAAVILMGTLAPCSGESGRDAQIDRVDLVGLLANSRTFSLHIETQEIGEDEIQIRLKEIPLYGANPIGTDPRQRIVKVVRLMTRGKILTVPEVALRDLFDPGFVSTLRVTMEGEQIAIGWAGGSGEREYRCKFFASSERFIRREILQLDNQSREVVVAKDL